jgi:hypothetical protein
MKKDAGLRIRVERSLRERFVETCQAQDRSAAQVIREFMRAYVDGKSAEFGASTQINRIVPDEGAGR